MKTITLNLSDRQLSAVATYAIKHHCSIQEAIKLIAAKYHTKRKPVSSKRPTAHSPV